MNKIIVITLFTFCLLFTALGFSDKYTMLCESCESAENYQACDVAYYYMLEHNRKMFEVIFVGDFLFSTKFIEANYIDYHDNTVYTIRLLVKNKEVIREGVVDES